MINQTHFHTLLFVIFFIFSISPVSIIIQLISLLDINLNTQSQTSIPCSYNNMQHFKPTSLKKLVKKPFVNNKINPTPVITSSKPTPVVVPTPLSPAQKAAALPFVQEPVKKSKSKAIGRFFKKFTKLPLDNKKQQHKITFVPIPPQESLSSDCNNKNNNKQVTSTPKITTQEPDSIASDYAQRIWDEDKTVYANIENVAEWIGNGKPMSNMILKSYMNKFDFKSLKLEQAFRVLCSKLHLKAETQQIDRILAAFAGRYYDCNPKCIFGTSDINSGFQE
ncbi:SEC7-like protein [Backusella circina FSU 941]|nr:SEC7-like protein [Backusella circina FSU 941]